MAQQLLAAQIVSVSRSARVIWGNHPLLVFQVGFDEILNSDHRTSGKLYRVGAAQSDSLLVHDQSTVDGVERVKAKEKRS